MESGLLDSKRPLNTRIQSMKCYATDAMSNPRSRVKILLKNLRSAILFRVKKI